MNRKASAERIGLPKSEINLLIASVLSLASVLPAFATDFSNAKKTYVPPSRIIRRVDFSAMSGQYGGFQAAGSLTNYSPYAPSPYSPASKYYSPALLAKSRKAAEQELMALHKKAQLLIAAGKFDDAEALLGGFYKSNPQNHLIAGDWTKLNLEHAKVYSRDHQWDKAAAAAREALYATPGSLSSASVLNQALKQTGLDPFNAHTRLGLADELAAGGNNTQATAEYRIALKLHPSAQAYVGLGNMSVRQGLRMQAKQEYLEALGLNPNSALAHRQLGLLRLATNDIVGANSDLSRAVILNPPDQVAGKALIELWQRQIARAPGDANNHMGLARAYQLVGDLGQAQEQYREVVKTDPNHPNLPAARQSFKLALSRQEAEQSFAAARTLESQGALNEAQQKMREALSYSPSNPTMRNFEGYLWERMGQIDNARGAYLDVLKDDPQNVQAAQRLKVLSSIVSPIEAQSQSIPSQAPPMQGLPLQPGPNNFSPQATNLPIPPAINQTGSMLPPLTEAPPAMAPPPTTVDPVANLSDFMVALRNQGITQQTQIQQVEDAAHSALRAAAQSGSLSADSPVFNAPGAAASLSGGPILSAPMLGSNLNSAQIPMVAGAAPVPQDLSTMAAPNIANLSPADIQAGYARLMQLQQENQSLQAQLQQTQQALQTYQQAASPPAGFVQTPPAYAPALANAPPPGYPLSPAAVPPPVMPVAATTPTAPSPNTLAAMPASNMMVPAGLLRPSIGPVKLVLDSVKPSIGSVHLKVTLQNDQETALNLPADPQALLRNAGQEDLPVKVSFDQSTVPPHSQIHGTIKVPIKQISPSADLVLVNLFPTDNGINEIHLTTPISFR